MKEIIVRTSVKHPIAQSIMQELDGKKAPKIDGVYKVIFEV